MPLVGPEFQRHGGGALTADLATAFTAQIGQSAHTALVALATCADAFDGPTGLGLDLAVQLVARVVFGGPGGFAPILEALEAAFLTADLTAVDPQRRLGQAAQKGTVVADQHEGRTGLRQMFFQPADSLNVQVVRRFVQQHQFGRTRQQARKRRAATFAARCGVDGAVGVELQPFRGHVDQIAFAVVQPVTREIAKRGKARQIGILFHIAGRDAGRQNDLALVGFDKARHDLHQGGFARAVAPDQRDAVAGLDVQGQAVENGIAAIGQRDIG